MKTARTKTTLDALLDRWLAQHEVDPTTRMNYESQIRNYIQPNLGDVPLPLFVLQASERWRLLCTTPPVPTPLQWGAVH